MDHSRDDRHDPALAEGANPAPKLTARQQQIFDLVRDAVEHTGAPPTRAEIAQQLGFRSANAAEEHLQALARKGVLELVGGTSRGIRLPSADLRAIAEQRRHPAGATSGLSGNRGGAGRSAGLGGLQLSLPLPGLAQLMLPLVGRVAAGSPILAQEHIDQTYHVEATLFSKRPDYLLRVRGMSMRDAGILDGDLLAVQKTSDAKNGQIVVARLGDDVTVKRFKRRQGVVELHPENPDFDVITVGPSSGEFAIEGLAVGLIRNTPLS